MKKIVLVALLAAAGCGSKKGPDCSAAINQGIDSYTATAKKTATGAPQLDSVEKIGGQLKAAMTQRCTDDKWQPDAVACFSNATSSDDLKACEEKLTRDQRTKLDTAVFPITMRGMGVNGTRMPPGMAGHPAMLHGGAADSAAPPAPAGDSAGSSAAGSAAAPPGTPVAPAPSGSGSN